MTAGNSNQHKNRAQKMSILNEKIDLLDSSPRWLSGREAINFHFFTESKSTAAYKPWGQGSEIAENSRLDPVHSLALLLSSDPRSGPTSHHEQSSFNSCTIFDLPANRILRNFKRTASDNSKMDGSKYLQNGGREVLFHKREQNERII